MIRVEKDHNGIAESPITLYSIKVLIGKVIFQMVKAW